MRTVYELVYHQMLDAGIASNLPEEEQYWVDSFGNEVFCEEEAAGHNCTMKLDYPEWLLFGDEVGTDTAQDDDGHVGGQIYLSFAGKQIELASSKATSWFTVMGLTAATEAPVMCICILSGHELGIGDALGFDYQAIIKYDNIKSLQDIVAQVRLSQIRPPVPSAAKISLSFWPAHQRGEMASDILRRIHKRLDELDVFTWIPNGPTPMVLYDGHDSRLQVKFLSCINQPNQFGSPMWKAYIGLPNGTSKWQVRDSTEQNGTWKMAMTRRKDMLVLFKSRNRFQSLDLKDTMSYHWLIEHGMLPLPEKETI